MLIALVAALLLQAQGPAPVVPAQEAPKADAQPAAIHEHAAAEENSAGAGHGEGSRREEAGETRATEHEEGVAEHIFHHVQDEVWWPLGFWVGGNYLRLDITKHVVMMWIAAGLLLLVFAAATRKRALIPKGLYSLLETFVLYIRDEIAIKNIGEHHGHEYVPYLCSVFFFILFMNLLGLIPFMATPTGNISVTVVLALFTFAMTQIAGMRAQGVFGYWAHLVPAGVPLWLYPLMLPVEILGLFTKPFALTVRLFANMVAGHIVIFFLLALTLLISVWVAPISVAFALGIFMLELFVALVQAYVFTMLSSLFIGMAAHAH